MQKPLVSVIIPTFNREKYLREAIESVVNQSYKNIEIIVVDDGSTENYAERICNDFGALFFKKENGGLSSARNFGIKNANGKYIALLDDDDVFVNTKIEKQVEVLENNKSIFCVHSSADVIDDKGNKTGQKIGASTNKVHKRSGNVFWNALGTWVVKSPTPLFKKEVFETIIFDEKIKVGEDLDFYWRFFYYFNIYYIDESLAYYRDSNDIKRLSKLRDKYIGVDYKIYTNFKSMKVNPVVLYFVAIKLAKNAIKCWNEVFFQDKKSISTINLIIRPIYFLKNLDK